MRKWVFLTAFAEEKALRQAELSDAQGRPLTSFDKEVFEKSTTGSRRSSLSCSTPLGSVGDLAEITSVACFPYSSSSNLSA